MSDQQQEGNVTDVVQELTDETFQKTIDDAATPVIVDFWAAWCGPCRTVGPIVEDLATTHTGKVTVGKVNVDENQATAAKFGIMSIPTLILFKDGKPVKKIIGVRSKGDLGQSGIVDHGEHDLGVDSAYLRASLGGIDDDVAGQQQPDLAFGQQGALRERRNAGAENDVVVVGLDAELGAQRGRHVDVAQHAEPFVDQCGAGALQGLRKRGRNELAYAVRDRHRILPVPSSRPVFPSCFGGVARDAPCRSIPLRVSASSAGAGRRNRLPTAGGVAPRCGSGHTLRLGPVNQRLPG